MSVAQELHGLVSYLNAEGGFSNSLNYERIAHAAAGLPWSVVEKAINKCKEDRDFILDHTYFVCSELEKAPRQGQAAEAPGAAAPGQAAPEGDVPLSEQEQELWNRISWMNTEGGFENAIRYDEVIAAAKGIEFGHVVLVLTHLEEKWQEVNDPTSWVCAALVKKRNGKGAKGPSGKGGDGGAHWPGGQIDADGRIRERVAWLNGEGGFKDALKYEEVAAKSTGVDITVALKVLSHLEEKRGEVNDPTSWVCAALIKEHHKSQAWGNGSWGQAGGGGGCGRWPAQGMGGGQGEHRPAEDGPGALDREVRRRIAWLNNEGGFGNSIMYREVADAASGLDVPAVQKIFSLLEDKRADVTNPTNWLCNALWKERGGKGGGKDPRGKGYGRDGGPPRMPPPPPGIPAPPPVQKTIMKR